MYRMEDSIVVPVGLEEAWNFFSNPDNLQKLTPTDIGFEPKTKSQPKAMYPGFFITYRVAPLLGIKMTWATEITQVQHQQYFVDEQRLGPYKIWHHEHHFEAIYEHSTKVTDIIHYALPLGFLGKMAHPIVIKPKLTEIFDFRKKRIEEIFGS